MERQLSEDVERLLRERPGAGVWLAVTDPAETADFDALATRVGLRPLGPGWVEIDADRARGLLTLLLHRDLAYDDELMPADRAEWAAAEFIGSLGASGARFATNTNRQPHEGSYGWAPATDHSLDCGIAVIGPAACGIYWVADED